MCLQSRLWLPVSLMNRCRSITVYEYNTPLPYDRSNCLVAETNNTMVTVQRIFTRCCSRESSADHIICTDRTNEKFNIYTRKCWFLFRKYTYLGTYHKYNFRVFGCLVSCQNIFEIMHRQPTYISVFYSIYYGNVIQTKISFRYKKK